MRRDDRPYDPAECEDELEAVESQWTAIWKGLGQRSVQDLDAVRKRPEFEIMWPYLQRLPEGSRILDGGCGMGEFAVWLTRHGYPTTGLDISRETIGHLRKAYPDIEFAVGDIRATGFEDGSYDAYFSWGTFEHFEDGLGRAVEESYRLLRPGGYLFVSTPFDNLRHALHGTLRGPWRLAPQREPTRFYQWRLTRGELARALAREGFAVEEVHAIHKRHGAHRWLRQALGVDLGTTFGRVASGALSVILPAAVIAHMILAVARKPEAKK